MKDPGFPSRVLLLFSISSFVKKIFTLYLPEPIWKSILLFKSCVAVKVSIDN